MLTLDCLAASSFGARNCAVVGADAFDEVRLRSFRGAGSCGGFGFEGETGESGSDVRSSVGEST